MMDDKAMKDRLESAIGDAVRKLSNEKFNERSGTSSASMTTSRIQALGKFGITGDELQALLNEIAEEAYEQGYREAGWDQSRFFGELRQIAKYTDSLSLYRFVEEHKGE